uniref:Ig-like domain-containing protein n=1 Tax=Sinocyclocheilus rhinocerous TaxID=307959 RepID=A0A673JKZ9_9TELE
CGSCHASGLRRRFGPAHFECRLTPIGDPTMIVEWLHDGKPLEAANRLRMVSEFGYCSLDYEAAYSRDSGIITCRATNKFGVDQTSATLIVKDEKSLVEETQLPEGRRGQRIEEIERIAHEGGPSGVTGDDNFEKTKPEIVLLPDDVIVSLGDVAQFNCSFSGQPFTEIIWDHNGRTITNTERVQYVHQGGLISLIIFSVHLGDQGSYCCTVKNRNGENRTSAQLTVEGGYRFCFAFDAHFIPSAYCWCFESDSDCSGHLSWHG